MFSRFDAFAKQFRREGDRWIFRFRQRGAPVEVDAIERERLIARHEQRRRTAVRLFIAFVFAAALLMAPLMSSGLPKWALAAAFYGSAVMMGMTLSYWSDQAVTAHLRHRMPVGERLGWLGRWTMRAEVTPWWQIALGLASVAMAGWLVAMPLPDWDPVARMVAGVLVVIVGAAMLFLALVKWTIGRNRTQGGD